MLGFPALGLGLKPHFCFAGSSVSLCQQGPLEGNGRTERRKAWAPLYRLIVPNSTALEATVGPSNNGFWFLVYSPTFWPPSEVSDSESWLPEGPLQALGHPYQLGSIIIPAAPSSKLLGSDKPSLFLLSPRP